MADHKRTLPHIPAVHDDDVGNEEVVVVVTIGFLHTHNEDGVGEEPAMWGADANGEAAEAVEEAAVCESCDASQTIAPAHQEVCHNVRHDDHANDHKDGDVHRVCAHGRNSIESVEVLRG